MLGRTLTHGGVAIFGYVAAVAREMCVSFGYSRAGRTPVA
jgi:hypothetical protein